MFAASLKSNISIISGFFMLMISTSTIHAQDGWHWQNPSPQGNDLYDMHVFDSDMAIAVGEHGTIIKSNNAGISWKHMENDIPALLRSVTFVDAQTGWAVGNTYRDDNFDEQDAVILHTTDGGQTWNQQDSNHDQDLRGVDFVDEETGFAVASRTILYTSDAGEQWEAISLDEADGNLRDIHFATDTHGWVVGGNESIFHTTDGGQTWEELPWEAEETVNNDLDAVHFTDESYGWAVGETIIHTEDGGQTWDEYETNLSEELQDVYFIDQQTGWAVGRDVSSGILFTDDGGSTWEDQSWDIIDGGGTQVPVRFRAVGFVDHETGWVAGEYGTLLKTTSSGNQWDKNSVTPVRNRDFHDIYFADPDTGWIAADAGNLLITSDGGLSWDVPSSATTEDFNSVYFIDNKTGWIAADDGEIWKATKGGYNLNQQQSGTNQNLTSIQFINPESGWVTGEDILLYTDDAGENWEQIYQAEESVEFVTAHFENSEIGWIALNNQEVVGGAAEVWYTEDGGNTFETQFSDEDLEIEDMQFADAQSAWLVGEGSGFGGTGSAWSTDDGGQSWEQQKSSDLYAFVSVAFADDDHGWILERFLDRVFYTEDGGQTWSESKLPTDGIQNIYAFDSGTAWAIGEKSKILHNKDLPRVPVLADLMTPEDQSLGVELPITFKWEQANFALEYQLQVSTDETFSSPVIDRSEIDNTSINIGDDAYFDHFTTYYWRIRAINDEGVSQWSNVQSFETGELVSSKAESTVPEEVRLSQNYPNPFNPVTQIGYSLPEQTQVTLQVFNLLGQRVATIVDDMQQAGTHQVEFDGSDLASGTYIYRLQAGNQVISRQMLLVK